MADRNKNEACRQPISLGCGTAQGFLLGEPFDADQATRLVVGEMKAAALSARSVAAG